MSKAICIQCGYVKKYPKIECKRCKFTPKTQKEIAKSIVLSTQYLSEESGEYQEFEDIFWAINKIENGEQNIFDQGLVGRVVKQNEGLINTRIVDIVRMILFPIILFLLGGLFYLLRKFLQ